MPAVLDFFVCLIYLELLQYSSNVSLCATEVYVLHRRDARPNASTLFEKQLLPRLTTYFATSVPDIICAILPHLTNYPPKNDFSFAWFDFNIVIVLLLKNYWLFDLLIALDNTIHTEKSVEFVDRIIGMSVEHKLRICCLLVNK